MNLLKRLLLLTAVLMLLGVSVLNAQVSKGGTPPSFIAKTQHGVAPSSATDLQSDSIPMINLPISFNVEALKAEDAINKQYGKPPRLGISIPMDNVNLLEKGQWTTLENGQRICRLEIKAKDAIALNVYYKEFKLVKGALLYIYNKDKTHVIGAFNEDNNPRGGFFVTEYVAGDDLILEYIEPMPEQPVAATNPAKVKTPITIIDAPVGGKPNVSRIIISEVGYAYSEMVVVRKLKPGEIAQDGFNTSGACMVNINCSEGANWQAEKNAVARLVMNIGGGEFLCSGTLIQNKIRDFTPYVITAWHCFEKASVEDVQKTLFYFHYEVPGCSNSAIQPVPKTVAGATLLVGIPIKDNSDGVLLLMNEVIPEDWGLYWSGWDRRNTPLTSGVGIHHPDGDVMKISTIPIQAESSRWPSSPGGGYGAHWMVKFAQTEHGYSAVQGGSSGSGLFNQEHRLVGTLTGGNANCDSPTSDTYYGKLWWHWDQSTDPTQQMKRLLDPINSNEEFIDGSFLSGSKSANFGVSATSAYAGEEVHYLDFSYGAVSWYWEFPGGVPATSTERNPVVTYKAPGFYGAKLTVNKGTPDELLREKQNVIEIMQKMENCPAQSFEAGNGTNTASYPLGSTGDYRTISQALYTPEEISRAGYIDTLWWHAATPSATPRKITIHLTETTDTDLSAKKTYLEEIVYSGGDQETTPAGWVAFPLQHRFYYSGLKNLVVNVMVTTQAFDPAVASTCYYTNIPNAHMIISNPVYQGSEDTLVNNNRPNMRFSFKAGNCAHAPKAAVQMLGHPFYAQSFDSYAFPPANWTVTKPGIAPSQWIMGNILSKPFKPDNGDMNVGSAVVVPDVRAIDTWLISEPIILSPKVTTIQFYVGFNGYKTSELPMTFYISTDYKATWKPIWTTPSVYMDWNWVKIIGNISQYADQVVYFAWRVNGAGGDYIGLDQIQIFEDLDNLSVNEGDVVYYTDKSTGPVINRKWTLPGATPATSTANLLNAVYNEQGVYDVELRVNNNMGSDSVVRTGVITVTARQPLANFYSNNGYTRQENYGRFIPIGGILNYTDTSRYVPKQWDWNFEGAVPATASGKQVSAQYDVPGTYTSKLTVSNAHSSDSKEVPSYVMVGGTDKIWNMTPGDFGIQNYLYGDEGDGYLTGTCIIKTDKFAEEFQAPQMPVTLSAVDVRFYIDGAKKAGEKITIEIYNCSPKMIPGPFKLLATIDLPVADINPDGYTTVTLPKPLVIAGTYYIAVGGFSKLKTQLSIASSELSYYSTNSSYACHLETWYTMPSYAGSGIGLALNIVPTVTYMYMNLSNDLYTVGFADTTAKIVNISSNGSYTVSVAQPWIKVDKTEVSGDNTFSFKCMPNAENEDRHGVIILNLGDALYRRVYITQTTGDSIPNLSASLMSDYMSVDLKWGASLEAATPQQAVATPMTTMAQAAAVLPEITSGRQVFTGTQPGMDAITTMSGGTSSGAAQVLRWNDGFYNRQFYYNGAKNYRVAALFSPEDLSQYHGGKFDFIEFYSNGPAEYRLLLYQDEVLILDSLLSNITQKMYNRVYINTKNLKVDATKSLRVTLDIYAPALSGAIAMDAGPAKDRKGNLIMNDLKTGHWTALSDFDGFETAGNWLISAYVKLQSAPNSYYRIYRNNAMIAETDKTTYLDHRVVISGNYCYRVSKVSTADDQEGKKSNEACVTIKPVLIAAALNVSQDYGYPLPTPEDLAQLLAWDFLSVNAKITKHPKLSIRSDITPTSPAGLYPGGIQIEDMEVEHQELYNIRYISATFNHRPRPITVSANENTRKAYGDPDPASIPYSVDLLVPGESLTGSLSRKAGEGVGSYAIEKGSLTSENNPNYSISLTNNMSFEIIPRPITIIPENLGKVYGTADPATLSYTVLNLLQGDILKGHLMREVGEDVGEYNILQGQIDNTRNPNYDITFKAGHKFVINPCEVNIVPDMLSKPYGVVDPVLTFKAVGMTNLSSLQGELVRVAGENVGHYNILVGSLSAGTNYKLNLTPAVFTVNPANLFVQADNLNIAVGSLLPKPTYTMQGFAAADEQTLRSIIDNSIYINADSRPAAGIYDIVFGNRFEHKNYNATFADAKLTVVGRPISAFIPGSSDSKNATFMPEGATYIQVFTSNGALIYEGKQAWDGKTKQGKIAAGIYYYVATMPDGTLTKGSVEVYNL